MTFNFIKELVLEAEDKEVLNTNKTMALTRSTFFKQIQTKKPELATALEGFWGHVDFVEFIYLTLDSIKLKRGKWKDLDTHSRENLEKLVLLHDKLFPAIAKKIERLPANYSSKAAVSAASSGRAAERDWLSSLADA